MKLGKLMLSFAGLLLLSSSAWSQLVVVHDPTTPSPETKTTAAEKKIFERDALPAVRKMIATDVCEEAIQDAGIIRGAFTAPGKRQSLIFYQYCETANGFGWNGLVLIEGDKVAGNFVSDGAWGLDIDSVPDINQNGILEFTLAYSGGMHQGAGGTGVDLMEFSNGLPTAIGWSRSDEYGPTEVSYSWKLTARPGKTPVFFRQKFISRGEGRPRAVGKPVVIKLGKTFASKFERVQ